MRHAELRRQGDDGGPQVRGQSLPPGQPGAQLRQGPGDHQPDPRHRPHPLSRAPVGRPGERRVGTGVLGRRAGRHRRPDPRTAAAGREQRNRLPRGPARRRGLHRPGAQGLGRGRAQQPHQHLLVGRPLRLRPLAFLRPAVAGPRQRAIHSPHQRPPGIGTLLQSPRPAHHRGHDEGREARRHGPEAVQHGQHGRPLDAHLSGQRGRGAAGHGQHHPAGRTLRRGVHEDVGELADLPGEGTPGRAAHLRAVH